MSINGERDTILRGMVHGAVDYLQKPIQASDLRFLWQHVVRREAAVEHPAGGMPAEEPTARPRQAAGAQLARGAKERGGEKRSKAVDARAGAEEEEVRPPAPPRLPSRLILRYAAQEGVEELAGGKKARVVWAVELHSRFVSAVNALGLDKAVPKRILDLMGVQGLTRENVASHLQKYRLVRCHAVPRPALAAHSAPAVPEAAAEHAVRAPRGGAAGRQRRRGRWRWDRGWPRAAAGTSADNAPAVSAAAGWLPLVFVRDGGRRLLAAGDGRLRPVAARL